MELDKFSQIEQATGVNRSEIARIGVAVLFIVGIMLYVWSRALTMAGAIAIAAIFEGAGVAVVEQFLGEFESANLVEKSTMLQQLKDHSAVAELSKKERKSLSRVYRHELVKRSALFKIAAAWIITVSVSAALAALLFYMIRGMMLPWSGM